MSINLETIVQLAADVVADYVMMNKVVSKLTSSSPSGSLTTSVLYHTVDEIILPLVQDGIKGILRSVPLIGRKMSALFGRMTDEEYLKVLLRMVMIAVIQKAVRGDLDIIEGGVLLISTYAVDFAAEIEAVQKILDVNWEIAF